MKSWMWITITVLGLILNSTVIAAIIQKYKFNKKKQRLTISSLLKHNYFTFMLYALNIRIKNLNFGSLSKTNIYRDLLQIKFKVFQTNIEQFVLNATLHKKDNQDPEILKEDLLTLLYTSINEYESKWRELNMDKEKIEYIIDLFGKWHYKTINMVNSHIKRVFESDIYHNNAERISAILDVYTLAFEITLLDVETELKKLNGTINNINYNSKFFK